MKSLERRKFLKTLAGSAGIGALILRKGTLSAAYFSGVDEASRADGGVLASGY